ncbi:MAG: ribonuclease III [bacterium]
MGQTEPDQELAADDSATDPMLMECQQMLGHCFADLTHLKAALIHASGANSRLASNERLEFLGDAILGAVVCSFLFDHYPDYLEGDLTRIKSAVVSRRTCAKMARELGMDRYLILGKGMGEAAQAPDSVLADMFESLVAAVYLDGGFLAAQKMVIHHIEKEIVATVAGDAGINYKSTLQQLAQKVFGRTPTYLLMEEKGPDHLKCFLVAARVGNRQFTPAWGNNKKDAEQLAARNALETIDLESNTSSL